MTRPDLSHLAPSLSSTLPHPFTPHALLFFLCPSRLLNRRKCISLFPSACLQFTNAACLQTSIF
jgi:hypothetical protein